MDERKGSKRRVSKVMMYQDTLQVLQVLKQRHWSRTEELVWNQRHTGTGETCCVVRRCDADNSIG